MTLLFACRRPAVVVGTLLPALACAQTSEHEEGAVDALGSEKVQWVRCCDVHCLRRRATGPVMPSGYQCRRDVKRNSASVTPYLDRATLNSDAPDFGKKTGARRRPSNLHLLLW